MERTKNVEKEFKLFISHSSKDKVYVNGLVRLFESIGIGLVKGQMVCTSVSGYGIPLDVNIYEYLMEQFREYNLHVILLLSPNYYASPACLNEMGAAWVLQKKYTCILLPGFDFSMLQGAIDPARKAIQMDAGEMDIKEGFNNLKDNLLKEFRLDDIQQTRWERYRDEFIKEIKEAGLSMGGIAKKESCKISNMEISHTAVVLLAYAGKKPTELIYFGKNSAGVYLNIGSQQVLKSIISSREESIWKNIFNELELLQMVQPVGSERHMFQLTKQGVEYSKQANKVIDTRKKLMEHLIF